MELELKCVSLDSKPISLTKLVPSAEYISNSQPRFFRMVCCTAMRSGDTTTKAARSSMWHSAPLKPSAHIVQ